MKTLHTLYEIGTIQRGFPFDRIRMVIQSMSFNEFYWLTKWQGIITPLDESFAPVLGERPRPMIIYNGWDLWTQADIQDSLSDHGVYEMTDYARYLTDYTRVSLPQGLSPGDLDVSGGDPRNIWRPVSRELARVLQPDDDPNYDEDEEDFYDEDDETEPDGPF